MIYKLEKKLQRHNLLINFLTYALAIGSLILVARSIYITHTLHQYDQFWSLLISIIPLLAAILFALASNRLIINTDINRENDRRQEIVRTTHHLIAITKDLHARVSYVKSMFNEDKPYPAFILSQIAETIENRYETLLEQDAYKYLPGQCVDIITRISGSIYGISVLAEVVKHVTTANPVMKLNEVLKKDNENRDATIKQLDKVMDEIQNLIDELFKLRKSLDVNQPKPK